MKYLAILFGSLLLVSCNKIAKEGSLEGMNQESSLENISSNDSLIKFQKSVDSYLLRKNELANMTFDREYALLSPDQFIDIYEAKNAIGYNEERNNSIGNINTVDFSGDPLKYEFDLKKIDTLIEDIKKFDAGYLVALFGCKNWSTKYDGLEIFLTGYVANNGGAYFLLSDRGKFVMRENWQGTVDVKSYTASFKDRYNNVSFKKSLFENNKRKEKGGVAFIVKPIALQEEVENSIEYLIDVKLKGESSVWLYPAFQINDSKNYSSVVFSNEKDLNSVKPQTAVTKTYFDRGTSCCP